MIYAIDQNQEKIDQIHKAIDESKGEMKNE
jgi:hypothetical protein